MKSSVCYILLLYIELGNLKLSSEESFSWLKELTDFLGDYNKSILIICPYLSILRSNFCKF